MVKSQRMPFSWLFAVADLTALWKKSPPSELEQIEQVYKATINNMASGIIVLDSQNNVLSINNCAQQIIQLVSGKKETASFVGHAISDTLDIWPNLVRYLYSSNKEYHTLLTCDTGSEERFFDVQIEPVYQEGFESERQKPLIGRFIVLQDCTERERSTRALQERKRQLRSMVEQLRKADKYQVTLADSVQQELQDPLDKFNTLVGDLQQQSIPEHLESVINDLHQEVVSLRKIVDGMDVFTLHRRPSSYYSDPSPETITPKPARKNYRTESFH